MKDKLSDSKTKPYLVKGFTYLLSILKKIYSKGTQPNPKHIFWFNPHSVLEFSNAELTTLTDSRQGIRSYDSNSRIRLIGD
jgi:hypothetical protein